MTTWRKMLQDQFEVEPEHLDVLPDLSVFDVEFDASHGHEQGPEFLAWGTRYVYFPVGYDGAEWVDRVPKDPGKHRLRTDGHIGS